MVFAVFFGVCWENLSVRSLTYWEVYLQLLDAEKDRAVDGIVLHDAAGLTVLIVNLEATGRKDRAIEAIW